MDHLYFCVLCVPNAFASVRCCLVDLLALVGDVYCIFNTFQCAILGQVSNLIVSFPDLCLLSYFRVSEPACSATETS